MGKKLNLTLKVWRQADAKSKGQFVVYNALDIDTNASFLEMIDILNDKLALEGKDPIAIENDCREGICGCCGAVINGRPHGPVKETTLCQLHMRKFKDGDTIVIEPFRANAMPVVKDLIVDRSAFDRIISKGGYVSLRAGSAPDAKTYLISKENADKAMDSAQCIGCAACVAACPNAAAMLFVSAKISQLSLLPQGDPERKARVQKMVAQMDKEGFGNCSNEYECEVTCPKGISVSNIARMNKEFILAAKNTL